MIPQTSLPYPQKKTENEKQLSTNQADSMLSQIKIASLHYQNTAKTQPDDPRAQLMSVSVVVAMAQVLVDGPQEVRRHDHLKENQTSQSWAKIQ